MKAERLKEFAENMDKLGYEIGKIEDSGMHTIVLHLIEKDARNPKPQSGNTEKQEG
ncbi:MAG: hypothetical protein LBI67_05525 [Treponema sp.]|jgi:hypothetical protein|nr:hypothetical protein [Treponema sp.]